MAVIDAPVYEHGAGAPTRSLAQRMGALNRANAIRSYRADLKRDMKAGRIDVVQLLADPAVELETMKVWDLLHAVPKWGRVKVNRMLTQARISPSKTVGGLSERQRAELVVMLRAWRSPRRVL